MPIQWNQVVKKFRFIDIRFLKERIIGPENLSIFCIKKAVSVCHSERKKIDNGNSFKNTTEGAKCSFKCVHNALRLRQNLKCSLGVCSAKITNIPQRILDN